MGIDDRSDLKKIIQNLEEFRDYIYDYKYDEDDLWYLDDAIRRLKQI